LEVSFQRAIELAGKLRQLNDRQSKVLECVDETCSEMYLPEFEHPRYASRREDRSFHIGHGDAGVGELQTANGEPSRWTGSGLHVAYPALLNGRIGIAAGCVGVIEDCLASVTERAKTRV